MRADHQRADTGWTHARRCSTSAASPVLSGFKTLVEGDIRFQGWPVQPSETNGSPSSVTSTHLGSKSWRQLAVCHSARQARPGSLLVSPRRAQQPASESTHASQLHPAMMSLLAQPLSPRASSILIFGGPAFDDAAPPKDRPFVCEEPGCGRRFNRKFTLSEHKKTHTGEKPYVCPLTECGRRFSTSGNLARHKRLHASLKPFECDINGCKRSFPSQEKLDHHIKIHTGRRTHVCRVSGCTKAFSTAGNLTRHTKNRHPELIRSAFPTFQYAELSPAHRPMPTPHNQLRPQLLAADHASPHMAPGPEPHMTKLEPVPPVFSPDSVELSSFQDELSAFQMACEPPTQPFLSRPRYVAAADSMVDSAVGDIARCSMSVLDEVIEFELTKDV